MEMVSRPTAWSSRMEALSDKGLVGDSKGSGECSSPLWMASSSAMVQMVACDEHDSALLRPRLALAGT